MLRRISSTLLVLLLLMGAVPVAHAQEIVPEVSTLEELQEAIRAAEPGDTIEIVQTIVVDHPATIGIQDKPLTIHADPYNVPIFFSIEGKWEYDTDIVGLFDLTLDSEGNPRDHLISISTSHSIYMNDLNFKNINSNMNGSAIYIEQGECYISAGSFENCSSPTGGAIYANAGTHLELSGCSFTNNFSTLDGGAVYSEGNTVMRESAFTGNFAVNGSGGAFAGADLQADDCTITGNTALYGGGLSIEGTVTLQNCKIYENSGSFAGDDLSAQGDVSIYATDYNTLFSEEMAELGVNACGWFNDLEDNRYSPDTSETPLDSTEQLTNPVLKFAMCEKSIAPDPEPEPEPELTPEPDPEPEPPEKVIIIERVVEKEVEPKKDKDNPSEIQNIICGDIELEGQAAEGLISTIKRFIPTAEPITRGTTAAFIYCLMTEDSQIACIQDMEDFYADLGNSPYKTAANALTAAGVLSGRSDGLFAPGDILTYGQLLTVMTHFASPPENFVPFTSEQSHWASEAFQIAVEVGWFPDLPVNLDAPATYGAFIDLLSRVFEIDT